MTRGHTHSPRPPRRPFCDAELQTRRDSQPADLCVLSIAVPDATLPRQLGNCSRRYPTSVTAPALPYLGNCSRRCPTSATAPGVALASASLQSSCIPAVVLRPWSRPSMELCVLCACSRAFLVVGERVNYFTTPSVIRVSWRQIQQAIDRTSRHGN